MTKVVFTSPVDMTDLDISAWFDATATNTSATSFTFTTPGQSVVVNGTGFSYFFGVPVSGTVNGFTASGAVDCEVTNINVSVSEIGDALNGPDPAGDMSDILLGGNDGLYGSSGTDLLYGYSGKDVIKGNKGADFIFGGAGRDVLSGGRGNDTFHFDAGDSSNGSPDRITDLDNRDWLDFSTLNIARSDITATYDAGNDTTTFHIDHRGDSAPDMTILADGDHTDFGHFIVG